MGRLKDTFFLGERSNFKLTIVHRNKEVRAPGGGKGPFRASFPQLTKRMEKSAAICHTSTLHGDLSSGASSH